MPLEFDTMTPAGRWSDSCNLGILDLRRACNDEVVANFPRFMGRWEDGTNVDLLLSTGFVVTPSEDDCLPSTISGDSVLCNYVIPNQQWISIGGGQNRRYRDLVQQFCKARNLISAPSLFLPDGSLDRGNPLSGYFVDFVLAELKMGFMGYLVDTFWTGDDAERHQFEGVLTQLDADVACEPFNPTRLNWATLTGTAAPSSPRSEIDLAHDSITIKGEVFSGMAGLDFAEFLKLWVERLFEGPYSQYAKSEVMLELWVPRNSVTTIMELAACLQPCDGCVNPLSDPQIRDRNAEFVRTKMFYLYPYTDVQITVRTSPKLINRVILIPMSVAGKPMAAWVFRSQEEQRRILEGSLPLYGTGTGSIPANELYPDTLMTLADNFEAQAIGINTEKADDCLSWWLTADAAIVILGRDNILSVTNIAGNGIVQTCDSGTGFYLPIGVAQDCTDGPGANELTFTVTAEEQADMTEGAVYYIEFVDGTVIGAPVTFIDGTTIYFTFPATHTVTNCTTFGGPVAIFSR